MGQSRRELLDEFLDFVGETADDVARETARYILNRSVLTIWHKHPWRQFQMPALYELSTVPGTRSYALPEYFGRVRGGLVRNLTTGSRIDGIDIETLDSAQPTAGTTLETAGVPQVYAIGGVVGVSVQPASTGAAVELLSSDNSDLDVAVTLRGLDINGRDQMLEYRLLGQAPLAAGTWTYIEEYSKDYVQSAVPVTDFTSSRGTVTLRLAGGGATLQTLFTDQSAVEHQLITFWPKPDSVYLVGVPILRAPRRLIHDGDYIPGGWGPALIEEMVAQWRDNRGEGTAAAYPRPCFLDLLALENSNRFGVPSRTRMFTG